MNCAICPRTNIQPLVTCEKCETTLHKQCYPFPIANELSWVCQKCSSQEENITCAFCPFTSSIMVQITVTFLVEDQKQEYWAHISCLREIPSLKQRKDTSEFIQTQKQFLNTVKSRKCYKCCQSMGYLKRCKKCKQYYHAPCGGCHRFNQKVLAAEIKPGTKPLQFSEHDLAVRRKYDAFIKDKVEKYQKACKAEFLKLNDANAEEYVSVDADFEKLLFGQRVKITDLNSFYDYFIQYCCLNDMVDKDYHVKLRDQWKELYDGDDFTLFVNHFKVKKLKFVSNQREMDYQNQRLMQLLE